MPIPQRQTGFSLVEMMIATVIGLLVLIGATQLYLTISRSQDRSEMLAERQQALTFGTESLMRDIRTATGALEVSDDGSELTVKGIRRSAYCPGNGAAMTNVVYYRNGDELMVDPDCADAMALVGGIAKFEPKLGEVKDNEEPYSVHVKLSLSAANGAEETPPTFDIVVVNRQLAMQNALEKD